MKERPTSITVISWILIVTSVISLYSSVTMIDNPIVKDLMSKTPIPIPIQYAMTFIGLLITLVSGAAMLKGHNWSRFLYVVWSVIGFFIGFLTSPMKTVLIPSLVVFLIIAFFLFRPKANDYFSASEFSNDTANS